MNSKKRLIILGGNPETAAFVEQLKIYGIHTIVIDPNKNAPAKAFADESYDVDCMDLIAMKDCINDIEFDGIIVGVADILVPSYLELSKHFGLPCYVNKKTIDAFSSKDGFNNACNKYGINIIPSFSEDDISNLDSESKFLVKPVDNGAGVGMTLCNNIDELDNAIRYAKSFSKSKRILIEKFMDCDDMFAYYTFSNGEIFLSATADRHKTKKTKSGSPVCIGATYPSIHQNDFINNVDPFLRKMFRGLNINDGVLNIQFFRDKNNFYAYDPGFRLQGEAPHIHILYALGIDQRKILADFALSQPHSFDNSSLRNRFVGDKTNAITIWVLLNEGEITEVKGLEKIKQLKSFKECIQRLFIGDKVTSEMIDTEKQVFARFYFQNNDADSMKSDVEKFSRFLSINSNNQSIISDVLDESILDNYEK